MALKKHTNRYKTYFQLGILAAIIGLLIVKLFNKNYLPDFEAYCPFGGILSLGSKYWLSSLSCQMSGTQIFMGLSLVLGLFLFGKLFCGYICPIGTVVEWLNKLGAKFNLLRDVTGIWDRLLRILKYVLLYFTAYYTITSSELFCKKFDPFFATVTGFNYDVRFLWAIAAILIVLVGSIFYRFFWCKYICPLSALSNIFANILITIPIIAVYTGIRYAGVDLHINWLLITLSVSGMITEVYRYKFYSLIPIKIEVDKSSCISCSLCNNNCPQGIDVYKEEEDVVTHPDCNLCMDCVTACPNDTSIKLGIFKKKTWIPPVIIIVLFVMALYFSNNFEFATLTERWGGFDDIPKTEKVILKDLKSLKCFGSASSLKNKIKRHKGIIGLDAYASAHKAVIYYNPETIDEMGVKKAVFSPAKYKIRTPMETVETLTRYEVGVWEILDSYDNIDLYHMLSKNKNIYGFKSSFGEPVLIQIYFNADSLQVEDIKTLINAGFYIKKSKGEDIEVEVEFSCEGDGDITGTVDRLDFLKSFYSPINYVFNKFKSYDPESLKILTIGFKDGENSSLRRKVQYLVSHVSQNEGIVRFRTAYTDKSVAKIYFVPEQIDSAEVHSLLLSEKLTYTIKNGDTKEIDNPFHFEDPVKVEYLVLKK